jgi:uncharacterized ParB-like nuclease family protein
MSEIFKADTMENVGENHLIADFGVDQDGKHYILTTNHIHGTEAHKYSGGAKVDCERVVDTPRSKETGILGSLSKLSCSNQRL